MNSNIPISCISKHNIEALLKYANKAPLGDFVEIGVYKGGSAWHLNNNRSNGGLLRWQK